MPLPPDPLAAPELSARLFEASSTMRHDVRNKLAAIKNATFYLKRKSEKLPVWTEDKRFPMFYGLVDSELEAAEGLLAGSADRSTFFEPKIQPLSPVACVERAIELARVDSAAGLQFEQRHAASGVQLQGDPDELAVAVRCLVENAAEASPRGGRVVVETGIAGSELFIEVADQGEGLSDELKITALRTFVTTRPGHAGLGLPVALRVAQKYAGAISFAETGSGTRVRMTLRLDGEQGA